MVINFGFYYNNIKIIKRRYTVENQNEIVLNGFTYILKKNLEAFPYVIVRTYSAGVFAGNLEKKEGKEVVLINARRLWYWDGAASLSQLAVDGVSKPQNCKFPCEVESIILTQAIEIITCTKKAENSIKEVQVWKN
jgi:hypothetical protein